MGIIKDGSISGVLPTSRQSFAIHYPGYPTSTERAVESLGGREGILKILGSFVLGHVRLSENLGPDKSKNLELNFRPEDPFSRTALGKHKPCNNFLLRISKKREGACCIEDLHRVPEQLANSLEQNSSFSESPGTLSQTIPPQGQSFPVSSEAEGQIQNRSEEQMHANIVSRVSESYCSALASSKVEAQIHNGAEEQLYADIVFLVSEAYHFNGLSDYQVVPQENKRKWIDAEPPRGDGNFMDLVALLPPRFSAKDKPEQVIFKKSVDISSRKKRRGDVQQFSDMEIEQCLAIDFNIKEIPKKVNWEKSIPRDSDNWQLQRAVCELFEERPIWAKRSLVERLLDQGLKAITDTLKRFLVVAAYYFSNGPFLRFWIRKGYDPRKDPESRIYQRIDFRVPPSLRSYCDTNSESGLKNRWEDICAFRVFPYQCQTSLQLFELKDDYIQQEIRKPANQGNCSLQTGWFSPHLLDIMRLRVSMRFLSVYPEAGAQSLLKSVSKRFEKAKRVPINPKDLKVPGEQEKANKGVLENEDKEPNEEVRYEGEGGGEAEAEAEEEEEEDDEDENEDDDLMEDDILGEGLDTEEALNLADQHDSFLHQLDSHNESFSMEYLQGLFCGFSGSAGDGEMPEPDPDDDGEFQIYEDDYSDDESN